MSPSSPDRARRRHRLIFWALPAAGIALGLGGLLTLSALSGARHEVSTARAALDDARAAVSTRDLKGAEAALNRAERAVDSAAARSRQFPLTALRPIPLIGSPVKALAAGARAGREVVAAGRVLSSAIDSFPTSGNAGVDGHDLTALHSAAQNSVEALAEAEAHLASARRALEGPAGAALPPVSAPARSLLKTVDDVRGQLATASGGLDLVSRLTAPEADLRLLLLAQDSMELRPTGGLVGSYGVLRFSHGTMGLEHYSNSGDVPLPDPPMEAPAALAAALDHPWNIPNANWWPDFPTSAATAVEMYRRGGGGQVAGVVAITEHLMADLLGAMGPVTLPGYPDPVRAEGFADRVLYEIELKRPLDTPRKKFLTELAEVVFGRLFSLPADQLPTVLEALGQAASAGDLQVWFVDPAWQAHLAGTVVDGALPEPSPDGDFLLFAESNMTGSKANADLVRDIQYTVKKKGGRLIATLDIGYRNEGVESEVNPYYNGLIRVYVPQGSELTEDSMGSTHDAPDGPYTEISAHVYVAPEGEETVSLTYTLPKGVDDGGYHLTWLRQPGTPADTLAVTIGSRTFDAGPGSGRRFEVSGSLK